MSRNVEKRVAELEFRNQQFETAAKESIGTLQRLEESLAFKTAKQGVDGLESVVKALNKFNPITNMLNHVTSAFETAKQRITIGFFDQIGFDIENLSKKFIDMLGPEYIKQGFGKYESEIASVQTLMNTTGQGIDEVMKYTEKLRWFTDETSYYYDDMLNAIGRFTSAGVGIDDAVTSMIGIANAAGYFGVNARNASHAMTGFANAIARGNMDVRNWQWIETAHMDVAGFKEELINTALAMGKLEKYSDGTIHTLKGTEVTVAGFRNTLRDAWVTTDVMNKTFAKFGGATEDIYKEFQRLDGEVATTDIIKDIGDSLDETGLKAFKASQETKTFTDAIEYVRTAVASNWSKTWQLILGNYDEARKMWSSVVEDLYELFVESGQQRNALLEQWKESNGRTELLASIRNFYEGIKAAIRPIQQVWEKLFPKKTGKQLAAITTKLREFSEKFRAVFEGIADIFEPAKEAVEDFCDDISKRVKVVAEPIERTTELLESFARAVIHGDYGNGQARREALKGMVFSYEEIQNKVNELLGCSFRYEIAQQEIVEGAKEVTDALEEENEELEEQKFVIEDSDSRIGRVQRTFAGLYAGGLAFMEVMKEVGSGIKSIFGTIKDEILWPLVDWVLSFTSVWGDSLVEMYAKGELVESLKKTIQDAVTSANKWIKEFADNFRTKIYPSIGPFFASVIDFGKKNLPNLWKIVKSGLKIAAGLLVNVWKIIQPFIPTLETIAMFVVDKLTWGMEKLAEYTPTITSSMGGAFEWVSEKVVNLVTNVQELWNQFSVSDAWSRLKTSLSGVGELFDDLGQIVHDAFFKMFGVSAGYEEFAENGPAAITKAMAPAPEAEENKNKTFKFIEDIANGISDFAEKITEKKDDIVNFFKIFTEKTVNGIKSLADSVTKLVESMKTFGDNTWQGLQDFLKTLNELTSGSLGEMSQSVQDFFNSLTETVKGIDANKLNNAFEALLKGGGLVALLNFSEGFSNIGKNLGAVPRTFNELLLTAQGTLLSYQKKINAVNLEKIAKAIGILALSVIGLSLVDQKKLDSATASIVALGLVAAAILKVAAPWIEAKAKLEGVKATAEEAKKTQELIADNGPAVLLSIFVQPLKDLSTGLSNAARIWAGKHKISGFLVSVGITLTLIMNVIKQMEEIQQDVKNLRYAAVNLGLIALALIGFATAMMFISRTFETVTEMEKGTQNFKRSSFSLSFSIALIAMVAALSSIVKSIGDFAELWKTYSYEQMTQSIGSMVIIMIGLGVLMLAASKLDNGLSVTASLLALATFLTVMVVPVWLLAQFPIDQLKQGVLALGALMLFIGGLILIMAAAERLSGNSFFFGVDIIAMTVGMLILAKAMKTLGVELLALAVVPWPTVLSGILKMGAVIGSLVLLGVLLNKIPGMDKSFGKLVKNILMLAVAAAVVGLAIPAIVDGLIYLGQGIKDHGEEIAIGFATVIGLILAAIIASKVKIVQAITTVLSSALEAFTTFIKGNGPMLVFAVLMVVNLLLAVLEALIPGTVDKIFTMLVILLESLAKAIAEHGTQILVALWHIVESLWLLIVEVVSKVVGSLLRKLGPIGEALADAADDMLQKDKDKFIESIDGAIEEVKENTDEGINEAVDDTSKKVYKKGGQITQAVKDTKKDVTDESKGMFDSIPDEAKQSLTQAGINVDGGFEGLQTALSGAGYNFSLDQIASSIGGGIDLTSIMETTGLDGITALGESIKWNSPAAEEAAEEVGENVGEAGGDAAEAGGEETGRRYVDGVERAIRHNAARARTAASEMAGGVVSSANETLKINSPSREGIRTGKYYVMGIANAITDYTYLATNASRDLSYKTIDSTRNALYNVSQALNTDLDNTSPVITPVMDLSNVRGGLSDVNGMLDNTRASLSGASMNVSSTIRHRDELAKEMANANSKALMEKLDSLNGNLGTLGTSMSGMQVVMDSGALVGEIASPMDRQLGVRAKRRERGI